MRHINDFINEANNNALNSIEIPIEANANTSPAVEKFIKSVYKKLKEISPIDDFQLGNYHFLEEDNARINREDNTITIFIKEKEKEANKLIKSFNLPSDWIAVSVAGNYTNLGKQVFYNSEYNVFMGLEQYDEGAEEGVFDVVEFFQLNVIRNKIYVAQIDSFDLI